MNQYRRSYEGSGLKMAAVLLVVGSFANGCARAEYPPQPWPSGVVQYTSTSSSGYTTTTRYPDGHRTVTRDAHGTDITVQRYPGPAGSDEPWQTCPEGADAYGSSDRFRWPRDATGTPDGGSGISTQEAYRQSMLERLRGYPQP